MEQCSLPLTTSFGVIRHARPADSQRIVQMVGQLATLVSAQTRGVHLAPGMSFTLYWDMFYRPAPLAGTPLRLPCCAARVDPRDPVAHGCAERP